MFVYLYNLLLSPVRLDIKNIIEINSILVQFFIIPNFHFPIVLFK